MAYYDKATSDELKDKFKDLAVPTGADYSGLIDYFNKGLQGMDDTGVQGHNPDLSTYIQGTMGLDFTQQDVKNIPVGYIYFDTTLNKPIWYTGTIWVDALGEPPYFTVGFSRVNMGSEIKHDPSYTVSPTTDDAKTDETVLNN